MTSSTVFSALLGLACRIDDVRGAITYSTHQLKYRLRFSSRRTTGITVHPDGAIEVVAPKGTDPKDVEARVRRRARWIVRQLSYFEQFRPRSKPRQYVGGETFLYLGRQYRLKLIKSDRDEVKLKSGFLVVTSRGRTSSRRVRDLVKGWYNERAKARILERYERIVPRFVRLGCRVSPPAIRKMSRRWGSYSKTGRVLLNPDLIRAPIACIDYVITHELAHVVHPHHGAKFFEMLEAMMPDWIERKNRLEPMLS
jgi:predicted metal-dependent hydrolase